eukprot:Rmarinus@m.13537
MKRTLRFRTLCRSLMTSRLAGCHGGCTATRCMRRRRRSRGASVRSTATCRLSGLDLSVLGYCCPVSCGSFLLTVMGRLQRPWNSTGRIFPRGCGYSGCPNCWQHYGALKLLLLKRSLGSL